MDHLSTLSLAESGELTLVKETVDVGEFLADVAAVFKAEAETSGVELRVDPSTARLTVSADVARLQQVLGNLLTNALRHTPRGGRVTLRATSAQGMVRLEVEDTGDGIPAADLPFVFDRFWRRARDRGQDRFRGRGLGLAIARQLVQAHGGTVSARSDVGRGSALAVDLPTA